MLGSAVLRIGGLAAAVWVCSAAALGDAAEYGYFYKGQTVALTLDTSQVVIRAESPDGQQRAASATASAGARSTVTAFSQPGWWSVSTDGAARSAADIEATVATLATQSSVDFVSPLFRDPRGNPTLITQYVLLRFEQGFDTRVGENLLAAYGLSITDRNFGNVPGLYRCEAASRDGFDVLAIANQLSLLPGVEFAEPNKVITLESHVIPNDSLFSSLWGLHNVGQSGGVVDMDIDAPEAWDITKGTSSVRIAVFDQGVQSNHPDLNVDTGISFTGGTGVNGNPDTGCDNHGTAVAGCITAKFNNGLGVVGVAPDCRVVSVKIGIDNPPCDNLLGSQDEWIVSALGWCTTNNIRVTNHSWGGGSPSSGVTAAFANARNLGIVHVGSSGNDNQSGVSFPAALDTVIAVGAIARNGQRSSFSNYGSGLEVVAPGTAIWTTDRTSSAGYAGGDYTLIDGTSFSCPYAAGVAALIFTRNPSFGAEQTEFVLINTVTDIGPAGWDQDFGFGLVNARAAVDFVPTVPGAFGPTDPPNGGTGVNTNATLTWSPSANAVSYNLTIDSSPTFDSLNRMFITDIVGTSYTLTGDPLIQNAVYYWRVEAVNFFGTRQGAPTSSSFTTFKDCDGDDLHDPLEIAQNPALDCNDNGFPDACDLAADYSASSLRIAPLGFGLPTPTFALTDPRDAAAPVQFTFAAVGDLNTGSEYVDVLLNGVNVGRAYDLGGYFDCVEGIAQLSVPAATFNAARAQGNGEMVITMQPSAGVSPTPPLCTGSTYIKVTVNYTGVPRSLDLNSNQVPDECDGVPTGACCFADGSCQVLDPGACATQQGSYQGDSTTCSPNNCPQPPTGACCVGQTCSVVTAAQCATQSGTYQGDGQPCSPNPCAPPPCRGDLNCDGSRDFSDIDLFVEALGFPGGVGWPYPTCPWLQADCNNDNDVSFADIDAFVDLIGTPCP